MAQYLTVLVEDGVSEEYAEQLSHAIRMLRGVLEVSIEDIDDITLYQAQTQVRQELFNKILDTLKADSL